MCTADQYRPKALFRFTYLPTCLSTYLPAYLPTYLPAYLPTYLPAYLPTYLPIYLPTYKPIYLSAIFRPPSIISGVKYSEWQRTSGLKVLRRVLDRQKILETTDGIANKTQVLVSPGSISIRLQYTCAH